jgi:putative transposase
MIPPPRAFRCENLPSFLIGESSDYMQADRRLKALGVTCSMSRSGDVWDNSVMESFFSTLKIERVHRRKYATRDAARADVFDYIERFYNPIRRHSTLRNRSPVVFERESAVA